MLKDVMLAAGEPAEDAQMAQAVTAALAAGVASLCEAGFFHTVAQRYSPGVSVSSTKIEAALNTAAAAFFLKLKELAPDG